MNVVHSQLAHLAVLLLLLARRRYRTSYIHPAVGILCLFLCRFQYLRTKGSGRKFLSQAPVSLPGTSTIMSRPHSSSHPRCQTRHSNLVQRTMSPNVSWQRTHIRLRQPSRQEQSVPVEQNRKLRGNVMHAIATLHT